MIDDGNRVYIAIDLKSFYASVECVARGRDPLTTNLVVADESRTEKTICLAVSPALKSYGIPGRPRLFEVVARVKEVNAERRRALGRNGFIGESDDDTKIRSHPEMKLSYIVAPPRMREYMKVSGEIYATYLEFVAPEDIFAYSVDEVFIDATHYLKTYDCTAHELAMKMVRRVLKKTGITATAGIGTNLYLAKIAMDIVAKHMAPDSDGVRIAELDVMSYRRKLWTSEDLTSFWRVGRGIAKRLNALGLHTMGDVARCSIDCEEVLYREFGVNAELLINHAWGYEPTTIGDVKAFRPENNSLSSGQVLSEPYSFEKGRLIVREMTDLLVLSLVEKQLVTDQMVLTVGYDIENLNPEKRYRGPVETDRYGRKAPKMAHGSINLGRYSSSTRLIMEKVTELYDRIVNRDLTVRRMYVVANHVIDEKSAPSAQENHQFSLFQDAEEEAEREKKEQEMLDKEKRMQKAAIALRKRFGKNAVLKGMNLEEGATTIERNGSVGGHRAGTDKD